MDEAEEDVLAYTTFGGELAEGLDEQPAGGETQQGDQAQDGGIGDLPERPGADKAGGCSACPEHDEWQGAARRYFSAESLAKLEGERKMEQQPAL